MGGHTQEVAATNAQRYLSIAHFWHGERLQLHVRSRANDARSAQTQGRKPTSGVFILATNIPRGDAWPGLILNAAAPAPINIAVRRAALFGARASLSVDRGDGCHFTCLRYPCARLTQESSAI